MATFWRMATDVSLPRAPVRASPVARIAALGWPAPAWGAIGVTTLFIGITCWWLTQDRSIPIYDAGLHLSLALGVHRELSAGKLLYAVTMTVPYPPFAYLIGALGIMIGGVGVASPIIAENVVFVSLLALGCYQVGRLAFSPLAGLLAVVFALGSPLITAQFHVFMIDAPETAMVAVSVWLIIATEGFSRIWVCPVAGLAVGLGMLTKEPFAIFVVGIVAVTAVRGGLGAWRGFAVFALVAFAVALPWYIREYSLIQGLGSEATASSSRFAIRGPLSPKGIAPPRLSRENLEWYFWSAANALLYLPLLLFAAVGWIWMLVGFVRRRPVSRLAPELAIGAFLGWLIVTETFIHDTRYSMPLLVYLAVFGAAWIVRLPRPGRIVATTALVLVAILNTLTVFGAGSLYVIRLAKAHGLEGAGALTVYSNVGFLAGGPRWDGDLPAMLRALQRNGVRGIIWPGRQAIGQDFSRGGVIALSVAAGLEVLGIERESELSSKDAVLFHLPVGPNEAPPCVRLDDGTGVWVRLGQPGAPGARDYCPLPRPHYYGP
jgi:4-amino-4-deoxy-L-arabinose transferase-like glycosyltransferase